MSTQNMILDTGVDRSEHPEICKIKFADLSEVLQKGWRDFMVMPTHLPFTLAVYAILSIMLYMHFSSGNVLALSFPILAGYTLLGPLFACGMYELSRRREVDKYTSRSEAFTIFRSPAFGSIVILGSILVVVYFAWIFVAQSIFVSNFGTDVPASVGEFIRLLISTNVGVNFLREGITAGFPFAAFVLVISVASFPMLLDRDVGVITAVHTSMRVFYHNIIIIAAWGFIVAAILFVAAVPGFLGLGVALPVLGHATWHLYRKLVKY